MIIDIYLRYVVGRLIADAESQLEGSFARLSQATGTKVIHISERDTQVSSLPKAINEFVNTWSIEGFYEEGTAPAELGWGTHERRLPKHAYTPVGGPGNDLIAIVVGIVAYLALAFAFHPVVIGVSVVGT